MKSSLSKISTGTALTIVVLALGALGAAGLASPHSAEAASPARVTAHTGGCITRSVGWDRTKNMPWPFADLRMRSINTSRFCGGRRVWSYADCKGGGGVTENCKFTKLTRTGAELRSQWGCNVPTSWAKSLCLVFTRAIGAYSYSTVFATPGHLWCRRDMTLGHVRINGPIVECTYGDYVYR